MSRLIEELSSQLGKRVLLGRGGPDSNKGVLVGVKEDYVCLFTDEGTLIHYPVHHLRSVTAPTAQGTGQNGGAPAPDPSVSTTVGTLPAKFNDLLKFHHGQKVQVFDHGPEASTGWVFECGEDFVTLVTADDIIRYNSFHIRSLSLQRPKKQESGGNEGKGQTRSKDDQKAEDKGK